MKKSQNMKSALEWAEHVQNIQKKTDKNWQILRYIFKMYSNIHNIFLRSEEEKKF